MHNYIKTKYIVFVLIIFFVLCIGIRYKIIEKQEKEAELEEKIKLLYETESNPLGMDRCDSYMDFSNVHINQLTINLAAYKYFEPDAPSISIEDVKEYLSEEYDENGEPRVLNIPNNIIRYINWYNLWNGFGHILDYYVFLGQYQDSVEEYKNFDKNTGDIETLNNLIKDFENCPDKEKYTY